MDPERWQEIERLYNAALERQPDARRAFLQEACSGDESLRQEVESLLAFGSKVDPNGNTALALRGQGG